MASKACLAAGRDDALYLLDVLDGILPAETEAKDPEQERQYQEEGRLFMWQ